MLPDTARINTTLSLSLTSAGPPIQRQLRHHLQPRGDPQHVLGNGVVERAGGVRGGREDKVQGGREVGRVSERMPVSTFNV